MVDARASSLRRVFKFLNYLQKAENKTYIGIKTNTRNSIGEILKTLISFGLVETSTAPNGIRLYKTKMGEEK